jgi:hypothetical protein
MPSIVPALFAGAIVAESDFGVSSSVERAEAIPGTTVTHSRAAQTRTLRGNTLT